MSHEQPSGIQADEVSSSLLQDPATVKEELLQIEHISMNFFFLKHGCVTDSKEGVDY